VLTNSGILQDSLAAVVVACRGHELLLHSLLTLAGACCRLRGVSHCRHVRHDHSGNAHQESAPAARAAESVYMKEL
jgi:hypothetical protein